MNKILRNAALMTLLVILGACANSGHLVSLNNNLLNEKSDFSYSVAFVSQKQPDPGVFFSDEEDSQNYLKQMMLSKGYSVGMNLLSLANYKAKTKGEVLLIECSYSFPSRNKMESFRLYQSMRCGAYDLYDGEKIYSGESKHQFTSFTSVVMASNAGMETALMNLPTGRKNQGNLISESEEFTLIEKR